MDKLQPLITHRFWILAGLVVPLAMYGFFSANSKLKAATEQRETELKGVLGNIPGGSNDPNEEYAQGLSNINKVYAETVENSIIQIWNKQQELMTWPPVVRNYLPTKFMGEFDYRGIVAYQEAYERLMLDLQSRVEPVMPLDSSPTGLAGAAGPVRPGRQNELADVPWKQKVILAASIPQAYFGKMRATSEEIWNAQIDIWLLRLLFDAVARLNEDKDSATEALLRRIDVLKLVGGDGEPVMTGGSSSEGESSGYGMEMYEGADMGVGSSYGEGEAGGGVKAVPIAFDPAQEFGSEADSSESGSDEEGSYGAMTGMLSRNTAKLRYIADSEEKPFLERGFYMSVIIMQDKIPDFLVELANSEWPVRVTRFHVGKNPYYTGVSANQSPYGNTYGEESGFDMEGSTGGFTGRGSTNYDMEASGMEGGLGMQNRGIEGVGGLTTNLPEMADAAMQHPELVQLDLCGVITMYKQPQSIIEAIDNQESGDGTSVNPVPVEAQPVDEAAPGAVAPSTAGEEPATESPEEPPAATTTEPQETPDASTTEPPPAKSEENENALDLNNL